MVNRPTSYASRKLSATEKAYSVNDKQCLAVIWAVQTFERYLNGKQFILETDQQRLLYLNRAKIANARLMRCALQLQPYQFTIKAIKGSGNIGADI